MIARGVEPPTVQAVGDFLTTRLLSTLGMPTWLWDAALFVITLPGLFAGCGLLSSVQCVLPYLSFLGASPCWQLARLVFA